MAATDYISPVGELNAELFPGVDDLTTHVEAVEAACLDSYNATQTEAWVYHHLYSDALLRLVSRANEYREEGQAAIKWGEQAITEVRAKKAEWKAALDAALSVDTSEAPSANTTRSKRVRTVW